jgi:geranylgeranyl diphosphate synthase type II
MGIKSYLAQKRLLVEQALTEIMPKPAGELSRHLNSVSYSLNAGGKRVRPILCMAAAEALGRSLDEVMAIPCALECIHTYSLIHDDLPAMDDDDLRRGKPTNHVVYGEAAAILAGDGLLTFAFELLSARTPPWLLPERQLQIIQLIARAAGSMGMVGGQALDIEAESKDISLETLQTIHRCKTGALLTASVQAGAILGGADAKQFKALTLFGNNIGLAFQIVDDLLNVSGTTAELGKAAGSDAKHNKATYPALFGVKETREKALESVNLAIESINKFTGQADPLRELANYIYTRTK